MKFFCKKCDNEFKTIEYRDIDYTYGKVYIALCPKCESENVKIKNTL